MSAAKIIGYSILAVMLLVGTYIYFWALDFVNANFGISLAQAIDGELAAWQFTVWVMAGVLALIIVFNGIASGHHDLEPISSGCYLGYTIVSLFIGCSAVTMNFPFNAFGSLSVQATIDPARLVALFGGSDPGIPPITIGISLLQLLMVGLSMAYAALRFLRALIKSRKETDESEAPAAKSKEPREKPGASKAKSKASSMPKAEPGSMDFMANVRKD